MNTILIIQARMGSTRLPGKVLLPLGHATVLDYVTSRCKAIARINEVLVATSQLSQDDPIALWCDERGIPCFRGSEQDVLSRYYDCAKTRHPDYVVRVTADCPFVDIELASRMVGVMLSKPAEVAVVSGTLPRGLATEMMSFHALEKMNREARLPRHREHVTYYAVEHPERFNRTIIEAPPDICYPNLRLTLDTKEDYGLCRAIADHFPNQLLMPARDIVRFLLDHPQIAAINAAIRQKPVE